MIHMSSKKIDDFEAFKIFLAMKSHFNNEYNYVEYDGAFKAKRESYSKRKDRYTFVQLSKKFGKKELEEFFLSLFLNVTEKGNIAVSGTNNMWTGNLLDKEATDTYKNWKKRLQSLQYNFINDCETIFDKGLEEELEFNQIFKSVNGNYPLIIRLEKMGDICVETVVVFDMIFDFINNVRIADTTYWPVYKKKVKDYTPFLKVDVPRYVGVMKTLLIEDYYDNYGQYLLTNRG
tara:strand:+ start:3610 stop:4308 length:699 start_codon:yes stop_codon:yes gene_type:complete